MSLADPNKLFLCCRQCMRYIPLHHPEASSWVGAHGCEVWHAKWEKVVRAGMVWGSDGLLHGGTEVPLIVADRGPREGSIFQAASPPDSYTCVVGPLEELAFGALSAPDPEEG